MSNFKANTGIAWASAVGLLGLVSSGAPLMAQIAGTQIVSSTDNVGYWAPSIPAYRPGEPILTGVMDRVRPEYDAKGVRSGNMIWYPSVTTSGAHNDNIYGLRRDPVSDFITRVAPQMRVKSNWSRHVFEAYGMAEGVWYSRHSDDDQFNGNAGLNGTVDVNRNFKFRYYGSLGRTHEDRSVTGLTLAGGPQLLDEPVSVDTATGGVGIERRFNRFVFTASTDYTKTDYSNSTNRGVFVDQSYRDVKIWGSRSRLAYEISPKTAVFVEGGFERRDYTLASYDNNSVRAVAGVSGEVTRLIQGEVFAGYLGRHYASGTIRDVDVFTYGGALTWYATQLLTVAVFGERNINETQFGGAGTYLQSQVGARLDYELRRNLILTGRGGLEWDDYQKANRADVVRVGGVSLTYLINRNVHMSLDYRISDKTSNVDSFEFTRNYVGATVRLQY